ncbi:MAG: serine/threonine protein kinase, partial [Deltaproteobacteria bacterium]|nr:serine/threonine protein kinase [Deltaproteobacteria bacterium]
MRAGGDGTDGGALDSGTVDSAATDSVLQALAFAPIARDLAPGAMLGDSLQIIRRVGAGGMGVVYLAFDRQLERELVVKVHRGDHDPARLAREAIAMARVQHPNVVTVYDVGRLDAQVYVAMEYVAGETLRTWIDPARGWHATTAMMRAIGDGLAAAHDAGLVHRDFKPENVLIGTDGRPRVSDFGLARLATAPDERAGGGTAPAGLTSAGAIVGTLGYMSSEQLACAPVDARSDQFAFCVVLFEALFGVRPFAGATRAQLAGSIARGEVRPMHGRVPGRLRAAVLRGLAADRARRFPSMRVLLRELDRALARRRIVAAGAAAVAIAGIAAGAMWLMRPAVEAPEDVCATAGEYVTGLWNPAVAARNAILYHQRDAQYGPGVVADISRNLGTFARDLRASSRRVCLGRHAAPAWSPTVQERAERCLAFYDNTMLDIVHDTRPEQVARIEGALRVGRNGTPVICAD